jgi:hypothetical protein
MNVNNNKVCELVWCLIGKKNENDEMMMINANNYPWEPGADKKSTFISTTREKRNAIIIRDEVEEKKDI